MKETDRNQDEFSATDGVRRTTGVAENFTPPPDPQVTPSKRRRLSLAYKIKVIEAVTRLREEGNTKAIGSYLRKEGLYYASITKWEHLYHNGELTTSRTGPKQKSREDLHNEIKRLRRKLDQTQKRLEKTQILIELQKKLSSLLEMETGEDNGKYAEK
jgi:hypothetical protein